MANNRKLCMTSCRNHIHIFLRIQVRYMTWHSKTKGIPKCLVACPERKLGRKLECSRSPIFHIMNVTDGLVPFQLPSDVKLLALILICPKKAEGPNWTKVKTKDWTYFDRYIQSLLQCLPRQSIYQVCITHVNFRAIKHQFSLLYTSRTFLI